MENRSVSLLNETLGFIRQVYPSVSEEHKIILENAIAKIVQAKESVKDIPSNHTASRKRHQNRDEILIVCLFLSKFGHQDLFNLNQSQALKEIAESLGVKFNYIKGSRDIFDQFFDNGRKGWNKPLKNSEQNIYDQYVDIPKNEYLKQVKNILKLQE
jgi:hypothetical protein